MKNLKLSFHESIYPPNVKWSSFELRAQIFPAILLLRKLDSKLILKNVKQCYSRKKSSPSLEIKSKGLKSNCLNQDSYLSPRAFDINSIHSVLEDAELCPSGGGRSSEEGKGTFGKTGKPGFGKGRKPG